ncbi:MAG: Acg family FMN-binding oxidoreductase [Nocardioides sp.]
MTANSPGQSSPSRTCPDHDTLVAMVDLACRAPSVHNTQPWRWVLAGPALQLHADATRRLVYADTSGRDLVVSCGSALHMFAVAAAGFGWHTTMHRSGHAHGMLASIEFAAAPVVPDATTMAEAISRRRTDRRRVSSWPVPTSTLDRLGAVAHDHGVLTHAIADSGGRQHIRELLLRAQSVQHRNDRYLDELLGWTEGGTDGIPRSSLVVRETNVPTRPAQTTAVPTRFPGGSLVDANAEDEASEESWLILATSSDDALAWLRTGEALAAIWLRTTLDGLSLVPFSQPIEVDDTRLRLQREVLDDACCPQLLIRLGWPPAGRAAVALSPRRPVETVVQL